MIDRTEAMAERGTQTAVCSLRLVSLHGSELSYVTILVIRDKEVARGPRKWRIEGGNPLFLAIKCFLHEFWTLSRFDDSDHHDQSWLDEVKRYWSDVTGREISDEEARMIADNSAILIEVFLDLENEQAVPSPGQNEAGAQTASSGSAA